MKILALNATYRPNKTTTQLTESALSGAASVGAETEMALLSKCDIAYCRNCLRCYRDLGADTAPCTIKDDVDDILEKVREADGILLTSPVHNGFVTGLMTVFFERIVWRPCRPTGTIFGLEGLPENRRRDKVRALATIVSAGGIPSGWQGPPLRVGRPPDSGVERCGRCGHSVREGARNGRGVGGRLARGWPPLSPNGMLKPSASGGTAPWAIDNAW